jgi:hypothetical protein
MREECRLRVFENMVLRRIFGSKRDEVTGEWRRLHNKELYGLYSSPNIIRVIKKTEMGRTCGTYGGRRGAYRTLVGKPEGRRPLGRRRRRWEDNIKIEVGWGGGAWTASVWLRIGTWRAVVNAVMNLRVP